MTDNRGISEVGFWLSVAVACIVVFSLFAFVLSGTGSMRSQSTYTGYTVDVVEDKGLIFRPTWVNVKTHPRSSSHERFCILPRDEAAHLPTFRQALRDGARVEITYHRPLWVYPGDCSSDMAIVDDVTVVNSTNE